MAEVDEQTVLANVFGFGDDDDFEVMPVRTPHAVRALSDPLLDESLLGDDDAEAFERELEASGDNATGGDDSDGSQTTTTSTTTTTFTETTITETATATTTTTLEPTTTTLETTVTVTETTTTTEVTGATTTTETTTTTTVREPCVRGIPSGAGVEAANCGGLFSGDTCTATCTGTFQGEAAEYVCSAGALAPVDAAVSCKKKSCTGKEGLPADSEMYDMSACTETTVGATCKVSCDTSAGYISQSFLFTCQDALTYSGTAEACQKVQCDTATIPTGVGVDDSDCQGKFAGDGCSLSCISGYDGTATDLSCDVKGVFSGDAPLCQPFPCDLPTALTDAANTEHDCGESKDDPDIVRHGDTCDASCMQGYEGSPTQWDCDAPTLSGTAPTCDPLECTKNMPFGMGLLADDCTGKTTGESCGLTCKQGREPEVPGTYTSTCLPTGSFEAHSLVCKRMPCGILSLEGAFSGSDINVNGCRDKVNGETCGMKCAKGFQAVAANFVSLTCSAAGDYSDFAGYKVTEGLGVPSAIECEGKPCLYGLTDNRGMTHDCTGKTTGETCTISATGAFEYDAGGENGTDTSDDLAAAQTWFCNAEGVFEGSYPTIKPKECAIIADLQATGVKHTCDGKTVGTLCWAYCDATTHSGTMVQYECKDNTTDVVLQPLDSGIACTANRRLESDEVDNKGVTPFRVLAGGCDDSSLPTLTAAHAHDCDSVDDGSTCLVECADGYAIDGTPTVFTCASGSLSGSALPTCNPMECLYGMPSGLGVSHDCTGTTTASTCTASCGGGYEGTSKTYTCQASRELSGTAPSCTAKTCSALVVDSQYDGSACAGAVTAEECLVACSQGYTIRGSAAVYTCGTDGKITGTPPTCEPNVCTDGWPAGADLKLSDACTDLGTGQSCSIGCADGYNGTAQTFTCEASGSVSGTKPSCAPLVCGTPASNAGGLSTGTCGGEEVGQSCVVGCRAGYKLVAGQSLQQWPCAWDADISGVQLQGTAPVCQATPCEFNLPTSNKFTHNCTGVATDQSCNVACAAGYSGTATTMTCGADKMLAGSRPTCTPQVCGGRNETHVVHDCDSIAFSGTCLAQCEEGYDGAAATWTCSSDGKGSVELTGAAPTCTPRGCVYNVPPAVFLHDCTGKTLGESCTVQCDPESFIYADGSGPMTWTCGDEETFAGSPPDCLFVTTTSTRTSTTITSTITTTVTTTRAKPTTVYVDSTVPLEQFTGSFGLEVEEAELETFLSDPAVLDAMTDSVAELSGVPAGYIEVTLRAARRLGERRLAAAAVSVEYVISIPITLLGQANAAMPDAASIEASLQTATPTAVASVIQRQLAGATTSMTFTAPSVSVWAAPTRQQVTRTSTTQTSSTTSSTTTTTTTDASYGSGFQAFEADGSASTTAAAIIIGGLAVCVIIAMVVLLAIKLRGTPMEEWHLLLPEWMQFTKKSPALLSDRDLPPQDAPAVVVPEGQVPEPHGDDGAVPEPEDIFIQLNPNDEEVDVQAISV